MCTFIPPKLFVLLLFLAAYLLIILKRERQLLIIWIAVLVLMLSRVLALEEALRSIDWNVLGVFLGTMVLSILFIFSGVPNLLANKLVSWVRTPIGSGLVICGLAGFISIFADNIATVLMVGPIAFEVSRRCKLNPVPLLIGVAISSNLQGCAILIGDSPSMILASQSGMYFNDFFWMHHRPGIFFAVELGAILSFFVLWRVFKRNNPSTRSVSNNLEQIKEKKVKSWVPAILMVLMILTLALVPLFPFKSYYVMAIVCLFYGAIGLVWHALLHKEALSLVKDLDWGTLLFLMGIFILVGSLSARGLVEDIAKGVLRLGGSSPFLAYTLIVVISVISSSFIDNAPYTIAMIPVAKIIASQFGLSPFLFLFGLLIGACLGGNITPIGAAANITAMGMLKKQGYNVKFREFTRIGLPFTLAAVIGAYTFIWLVWGR